MTTDMQRDLQAMADNCIQGVMHTDIDSQVELMNLLGDFCQRQIKKCQRLIAEDKARLN